MEKIQLTADKSGRTELTHCISDPWKSEAAQKRALELINSGADPEQADNMGFTYLHFAAQLEDPVIVKALLENGADPNAETLMGASPLQLAVVRCKNYDLKRSYETIKLLLEAGADPDKKSNDGFTVRELIEGQGVPEIEELVCNWGK